MAPSSSADALRREFAPHAATLRTLAARSIRAGLDSGAPLSVRPGDYPAALRRDLASFVTLRRDGELRGCVGSAYAVRPLVEDVARNAFQAAFSDTRFAPLARAEFDALAIELSLLTPPAPLSFDDEADLLAQLEPGRDGLMLEHDWARGLFLPQVWEMVPDRRDFLAHLKAKAGLPRGPLAPDVRALRFEVVKLAAEPALTTPTPA